METLSQCVRQEICKREFDEMWDIPKLYISAYSNSVQLVMIHPVIIDSLPSYKELTICTKKVEEIMIETSLYKYAKIYSYLHP